MPLFQRRSALEGHVLSILRGRRPWPSGSICFTPSSPGFNARHPQSKRGKKRTQSLEPGENSCSPPFFFTVLAFWTQRVSNCLLLQHLGILRVFAFSCHAPSSSLPLPQLNVSGSAFIRSTKMRVMHRFSNLVSINY